MLARTLGCGACNTCIQACTAWLGLRVRPANPPCQLAWIRSPTCKGFVQHTRNRGGRRDAGVKCGPNQTRQRLAAKRANLAAAPAGGTAEQAHHRPGALGPGRKTSRAEDWGPAPPRAWAWATRGARGRLAQGLTLMVSSTSLVASKSMMHLRSCHAREAAPGAR